MKERIARAKQALPNGYCGLPLVQSCPHPNACLSCESFLTDGSFRSVHHQQQAETRRLLEKARKQGCVRLIEVLERDEQSLARILEGLEAIEADHADDGADELDLRDLARGERKGRLMSADEARSPLVDAAARRTLDAEQRVRAALRELDSDRAAVTFAGVAERAQVRRAFLYQHAELRAEIEALRTAQAATPAPLPVRQRASDASLRARLRAALDERQRQRDEIARLREELALAHGRVRELELDRRVRRT